MSLTNAYKTSGKIFEQASKLYQPGVLEQLRAIKEKEVIVVQGQYDHIEKLLDTIKVPYKMLLSAEEVANNNRGRVIFVNCAQYNGVPKSTKNTIEQFVNDGGRLVTTDWSLGFVNAIFPGKFKKLKDTTNDVVEIQCPTDLARKFVGLNYAQCHPKWWLEGSSHIYSISKGVMPIITSNEMEGKYGQPFVASGFRQGKGEVIHFISHLELQRTKLKTEQDNAGLDTFLEKMKISKTADMDDAKVAELESAYSTLNTVAYLCLPVNLLNPSTKSTMTTKPVSSLKSKSLA